jgi:hypothetical protein
MKPECYLQNCFISFTAFTRRSAGHNSIKNSFTGFLFPAAKNAGESAVMN